MEITRLPALFRRTGRGSLVKAPRDYRKTGTVNRVCCVPRHRGGKVQRTGDAMSALLPRQAAETPAVDAAALVLVVQFPFEALLDVEYPVES